MTASVASSTRKLSLSLTHKRIVTVKHLWSLIRMVGEEIRTKGRGEAQIRTVGERGSHGEEVAKLKGDSRQRRWGGIHGVKDLQQREILRISHYLASAEAHLAW
ncbi:hypothetical protein I3842_03G268600 [Carya illinoinensis]|uniref:Uncharacterized protein n=1 Tax=Carya illinoinensis TaxID=32201 RepID=A0A922FPR7_CARIL|nr:hypothetical protein I3842_03G268600 [Carya illinoinensis]